MATDSSIKHITDITEAAGHVAMPKYDWRYVARLVILATVYFGAAKLGLSMGIVEQVSAVWPPTGVALAALLLFGKRLWPGIALGAFLANATANEPLIIAAGIALGNTLEALVGAWMLRRLLKFDNSLERLRDVFGLIVPAACVSTTVSASIGVASLCLGGVQPWSMFGTLWLTWWLGDAMGDLVMAPVLLTWATGRKSISPRRILEAVVLTVGLISVSFLVFSGILTTKMGDYSLKYSVFPFAIWAALRFGQRGVTAVILAAASLAIWGTMQGFGPFGTEAGYDRLLMLQVYMATVAVTALLLGAALNERRRAEEQVQQQREWFRVTLRSIGDAVIATDARGRITFLNPIAEALTGWSQDALGKHLAEVCQLVDEETRKVLKNPVTYILQKGSTVRLTQRTLLLAKDGRELAVEDSAAPICDVHGQIIGLVQVFRDISARRRDEQRLRVLHAVTRILSESNTLAEAAPKILRSLCESLSWQVGALWLVNAETESLRCVEFWHVATTQFPEFEADSRRRSFAKGIGMPGRVWAGGQPAWIPDVVRDDNFPRAPHAAKEGLHGAVGFPIRLGTEVLGVIEFFSRSIRQPDVGILHMMATIGSQIGQFIERQHSQQAIRVSEERFRTTFTHAAVGMALTDLNGRFQHVNPAYCAITGYSESELYERDFSSISHPDDLPSKLKLIRQLLDGTIPSFVIEKRYVPKHGGEVWVQNSVSLIHDRRNRPLHLVLLTEDITERKRAEHKLRASEEQLRLALEAGHMGAWDWNIVTGAVSWSPALEVIHGLKPGSFGGNFEAFLSDIHPEDRDRLKASIGQTIERGVEYRIIRPDQNIRWVEGRGKLYCSAEGQPVRMTGVCVDITERKQAAEALRQSEERNRSVVDHVIDGIVTIDELGAVDSVNPAAERLFGYRAADVIGRNVKMLMPEPYHSEHDGYLANFVHTGEAKIIGIGREVVGRRQDGSTFPMELAVSAFRIGNRRLFTGIVRDITERKRAEERLRKQAVELQEQADRLAEADRRKDEFLALLAHELRNPLAPIRNGVEAMHLMELATPQLADLREMLKRQVEHLSRLVDDLLDVSRVTRGKIQLQKQPIELATVISQAVETCRPLITERRQELVVVVPPESMCLDADPIRLVQVFVNLLNNASKYSKENSRIVLAAACKEGEAVVRVRDQGVGIAADMLPRVFDLFAQADASLARSDGGLGIGLTLVRRLVELHGGRVQASSEGPNQGSEFVVWFPLLDASATHRGKRAKFRPLDEQRAGSRALRVLIVDDNKDSAKSLALLLKLLGHEVATAHDGPDALALAATFQPEVVLLDIGLPGMDGLEVAQHLRRRHGALELRIIAMTGYGQEEDRRRTQEAGFNAHLVKPVDLELLQSLLQASETGEHR